MATEQFGIGESIQVLVTKAIKHLTEVFDSIGISNQVILVEKEATKMSQEIIGIGESIQVNVVKAPQNIAGANAEVILLLIGLGVLGVLLYGVLKSRRKNHTSMSFRHGLNLEENK